MKLRSLSVFTGGLAVSTSILPALSLLLASTEPLMAGPNKGGGGGGGGGSNTFKVTGSMNVPRFNHTTILLADGQVLAVMGDATGANTAELYDPATGKWTLTGTPGMYHELGSATLLADGEVLIAGGGLYPTITASAELYNPSTGQWTATGSLPLALEDQAAVLLPDGEVLVVGGENSTAGALADAELYNPATGTWQPTAGMHQARVKPAAQVLADGTVLVAGGSSGTNVVTSAEIYNPATGAWTMIANMPTNAPIAQSAPLPNGDVLVARVAFYDPGTGTRTATGPFPLAAISIGPNTATTLTTGEVLLTGFRSTYNSHPSQSYTRLYNFAGNSYTVGASMNNARSYDAATLLPNGQVLVSGGRGLTVGGVVNYLSSAELYTP
jgi:hypothetical protein